MIELIRLQRVDPDRGAFDHYEIEVVPELNDLFGSALVVRRFGRIGETLQEKTDYFGSPEAAKAFASQKLDERVRSGYMIVEGDNSLRIEDCFFCRLLDKPEEDPCFVATLSSTTMIVGWDQTYRGRSILVINKHIPDFFRVQHREILRLLSDIKLAEDVLRRAFEPAMMNYLFMGNVTQHAHLHLVPRYADDPNFGSSPFLDTARVKTPSLQPETYRELADRLREKMHYQDCRPD